MNRKIRTMVLVLAGMMMVSLIAPIQAAAAEVKITGVVSDTYQVVADDGTVYDVADTDTGNELLDHVSRKVAVVGTVGGEEEVKVLTVLSFKVLEDE